MEAGEIGVHSQIVLSLVVVVKSHDNDNVIVQVPSLEEVDVREVRMKLKLVTRENVLVCHSFYI